MSYRDNSINHLVSKPLVYKATSEDRVHITCTLLKIYAHSFLIDRSLLSETEWV